MDGPSQQQELRALNQLTFKQLLLLESIQSLRLQYRVKLELILLQYQVFKLMALNGVVR